MFWKPILHLWTLWTGGLNDPLFSNILAQLNCPLPPLQDLFLYKYPLTRSL